MSALPVMVDLARISGILEGFSREIEQIGEVLCSNPELAANHMVELQAFDRVSQYLRAIADLLDAEDHGAVLAATGLDGLREALGKR